MCGICGFIGETQQREAVLASMMDVIRHRGPDSEGCFHQGEASIGFRRLSIIDLEGGNQPIFNEDGSKLLVFNGEIYNYKDLRKELKNAGHVFSTDSDSEVLLHGYEEYGEALLPKLRGMFGFAIWDMREKKLFAARDFFGIKPLHYSVINGSFVFGSEIKSILCFPGCNRVLNRNALEQYLSFQYSALPETFFEGIFRLLPGHMLTWQDGRLSVKRYYSAELCPAENSSAGTEKKLEDTLQMSVRRHMISDVEVGAFLSGGVDSSYLVASLGKVKTFTVGFLNDDNRYSEIKLAEELKGTSREAHYSKVISKDEFRESIPKVMYYMDEPSGDAAAIALYFVAREAAKHVKVVLSGEGADEFFGGYNIYLEPHALRYTRWLPAGLRRAVAGIARKMPDIKGRDYLIRSGTPIEERYIGNACIFSTAEKQKLLKHYSGKGSSNSFLSSQYKKTVSLPAMTRMQQIDIDNWLPGDILQKADRMSMANSLELRVPYLDYDVFQLARQLPEADKVHDNTTKYLFRKVARKKLPGQVSARKKLGFPVPIRLWIREDPMKSEIEEAFRSETAKKYFHTEQLMKLLEEHIEKKSDNSRKIWTVYMFLVWHRVYFETPGFRP